MADWPRAIKPEDRVKYLIQARQDVGLIDWDAGHGGLRAVTDQEERAWITRTDDVYEAWYATDYSPEVLVGEYATLIEAQKAIKDHLVVTQAVQQAWEDVAS